MVKFVLGVFTATAIALVAASVNVDWGGLARSFPQPFGSRSSSGPPTEPDEMLQVIQTNTDSWTETRRRGESTRDAYEQRLATAREKLEFVRHQQKSLAVAYRDAESSAFPMQWMSRYYDRSEALDQLDKLFQEEEQLQVSCEAFRKAIAEAQTNVNEAIERLARNQLQAQMAEATAYFALHRQTVGADNLPEPDFLKRTGAVRTVDELQAEQQRARDTNQRLDRLNALLQNTSNESTAQGQSSSKGLPEQIAGLLSQKDAAQNEGNR